MKQQKNEEYGKFWSGFAIGAGVCGILAMTLGTKQGRETLRKTMEYLEGVEGTPDQVHHLATAMQKIGGALIHQAAEAVEQAVVEEMKREETKESASPPVSPPATSLASPKPAAEGDPGLSSIIDRMRSMTAGKKADVKFFRKTKK